MEIREINDQRNDQDITQAKLTQELIKASEAYYNDNPIMSDMTFDKMLEELKMMEVASGFVYEGSPTIQVGAKTSSELADVRHEHPALSLDKVKYKEREEFVSWLKNGRDSAVISWKNDGITGVATYDNGKLTLLATRGDGEVGSDITHNAPYIDGIPAEIPFDEHLVVRGELVMDFDEFERINSELPEGKKPYENPRNLASATVQLPSKSAEEIKKRKTHFVAFELVTPEPVDDEDEMMMPIEGREWTDLRYQQDRFAWMEYLGFDVVDHECCDSMDILKKIDEWQEDLKNLKYPTDGLVITFNDMVYGMSLGNVEHHFNHSLALKWTDETQDTIIRDIEWSVGKTGRITPVAIFDPVRLGLGSTVTRASLHNISIMNHIPVTGSEYEEDGVEYQPLMYGSKVQVYLANQIIPQIASVDEQSGDKYIQYPQACPVCGHGTTLKSADDVEVLWCTNEQCGARQVGNFVNSFSKDGLNVKGLAESQIQDLIDNGLIETVNDFYSLRRRCAVGGNEQYKLGRMLSKDGWGSKKWTNLLDAIDASRKTTLQKFLYSLNIPLLGNDLSKKLSRFWNGDIRNFRQFIIDVNGSEDPIWGLNALKNIDGIGEEKAGNIFCWIRNLAADREANRNFIALIGELKFEEPVQPAENSLEGLTFVITGAVHVYKNRDEFKASVEARGGKVAGSVSNKTSYLVNNDISSTSGKNAKAKQLNIPIISEDEFIEKFERC